MIPPTANGKKKSIDGDSYSHSVCRSKELLSCAKTAWKIQQQKFEQQQQQQDPLPTPNLQLAPLDIPPMSLKILEDGLTLLRAMDFGLKELQKLVRRRGHTNDPTSEISLLVKQLEQDTEELTEFCKQVLLKYSKRRKQEKRHWDLVVQWFQQVANQYSTQLQDCLKIRGEVLADQAQQRKKLVDTSKKKKIINNPIMGSKATPLFDSPLFQQTTTTAPLPSTTTPLQNNNNNNNNTNNSQGPASSSPSPPPPPPGRNPQQQNYQQSTKTNGNYTAHTITPPSTTTKNPYQKQLPETSGTPTRNQTPTSYYGGAGGGYGGGGYYGGSGAAYGGSGGGGTASYSMNTGMRQRRAGGGPAAAASSSSSSNIDYQQEEEEKVHYQIQQRQERRQTRQRLDEAQQAESMLGELGQLFGKMSNLIVQQGEQLEKIEDDVEAAHADILSGQEEITKLYHIKKGNRPLIIKTFAILIFLIIFMRAYKN